MFATRHSAGALTRSTSFGLTLRRHQMYSQPNAMTSNANRVTKIRLIILSVMIRLFDERDVEFSDDDDELMPVVVAGAGQQQQYEEQRVILDWFDDSDDDADDRLWKVIDRHDVAMTSTTTTATATTMTTTTTTVTTTTSVSLSTSTSTPTTTVDQCWFVLCEAEFWQEFAERPETQPFTVFPWWPKAHVRNASLARALDKLTRKVERALADEASLCFEFVAALRAPQTTLAIRSAGSLPRVRIDTVRLID